MKPPKFEYHAPTSLDEALAALGRYGGDAKVLAGGQSLMPLLNFRLARPAALVDLNRIASLAYIRAHRDDWAALSARWRNELDLRIAQLVRLRDELTNCIGCGCLSLDRCALSNPYDELGDLGSGPRRLFVDLG